MGMFPKCLVFHSGLYNSIFLKPHICHICFLTEAHTLSPSPREREKPILFLLLQVTSRKDSLLQEINSCIFSKWHLRKSSLTSNMENIKGPLHLL